MNQDNSNRENCLREDTHLLLVELYTSRKHAHPFPVFQRACLGLGRHVVCLDSQVVTPRIGLAQSRPKDHCGGIRIQCCRSLYFEQITEIVVLAEAVDQLWRVLEHQTGQQGQQALPLLYGTPVSSNEVCSCSVVKDRQQTERTSRPCNTFSVSTLINVQGFCNKKTRENGVGP